MKIVYLATGAAGMYCGSCLHDNTLAAALVKAGENVLLVPAYTPLRTDEEDMSDPHVVFGGISVYLQQKSAIFRHTPWWLDALWERPGLVGWFARRAATTRPDRLGDLTVSMLSGEEGRQKKELEKLLQWLARDIKPDVVHLSNTLLLGMARRIRGRLDVPVVCSLSGEDIFLEKLTPPYYRQARSLLAERSRDVDVFVAMNNYYADYMAEYLPADRQRIRVVPHGLRLEGHGTRRRADGDDTLTIGYLARICHDKGLHLLVDAFCRLARKGRGPALRLKVAGYMHREDRPYLDQIEGRLADAGLADRYEYVGELDRPGKIAFLQSLDVMSLPTVYRESKGLSVFEAWANAVPVVLPSHGAFPEMIEDTGGGLLCRAGDPESLAEELGRMIDSPELASLCGQRGQSAVRERYHDGLMAERTRDLYRQLRR